ncbi:MAG: hypothetical protein ACNYWM_09130 [Methanosarcinales archaeon]|jgi:hypothetical protein
MKFRKEKDILCFSGIADLFIVGMGSWIILRWYYNQRGDVR